MSCYVPLLYYCCYEKKLLSSGSNFDVSKLFGIFPEKFKETLLIVVGDVVFLI